MGPICLFIIFTSVSALVKGEVEDEEYNEDSFSSQSHIFSRQELARKIAEEYKRISRQAQQAGDQQKKPQKIYETVFDLLLPQIFGPIASGEIPEPTPEEVPKSFIELWINRLKDQTMKQMENVSKIRDRKLKIKGERKQKLESKKKAE